MFYFLKNNLFVKLIIGRMHRLILIIFVNSMLHLMYPKYFLTNSFEITANARENQLFRQFRMLFQYMPLVAGALDALKFTCRALVKRLIVVGHLVSPQCIVIVRFVFTCWTMEFLFTEMCRMMAAIGLFR